MLFRFLAAALLLAACSSDDASSADGADRNATTTSGGDATQQPERVIEVSSKRVEVAVGKTALVEVRLLDLDDEPVTQARVGFALIGRAGDASLAALDAVTDEDGYASNTLIAGEEIATFRVRVSAQGAPDVFVDVAVEESGVGSLLVDAAYEGTRVVSEVDVSAQVGASCTNAEPSSGDPTATTDDDGQARLKDLPAGTTYAVMAVAWGDEGAVLARGCTDEVQVKADMETSVRIGFVDEPLSLADAFVLDAELDATHPALALANVITATGHMLVQNAGSTGPSPMNADARFLLDGLDMVLRDAPNADAQLELANDLNQDRMAASGSGVEPTLQSALASAAHGPRPFIERLAGLATERLATMTLLADVAVNGSGSQLEIRWQALEATAEPVRPGMTPPKVLLAELAAPKTADATLLAEEDLIELDVVRFPLPFGSLATLVVRGLIEDEEGHAPSLRELFGCDTFGTWIASADPLGAASVCNEACTQLACEQAIETLISEMESALLALDESRPRLSLQGSLELADEDGDLVAERMSSDLLWGEWEPESDAVQGDFVSGSARATIAR
jgi:hypothetical protein